MKTEVELVRRFDQFPSDAGASRLRYAIIGIHGAATFTYMDLTPDPDPRLLAIQKDFKARFGHPLYPLWADIGYHALKPQYDGHRPADCDLNLRGTCYFDGSAMHAMNVGPTWDERHGRDPDWMYRFLAAYYNDLFYPED